MKETSLSRREFIQATGKVAAAAFLGARAFGVNGSTVYAGSKKVCICALTQEPVQYNPLLYVNAGPENVPEACVFDALWDVNEKGELVPNLAAKIPTVKNGGISPDGKSWKIELKEDIKWQDGHPFSAKDVEFTYKTIINPKVAIRSRLGFDLIKDFSIKDEYNFEITLSKVYAPYVWSWQSMHIVPEHILSKVPDINTAAFNTNPIGTGPFLFKERVSGSHATYKKNPNYHRNGPNFDTFINKIIPDQTLAYTQLKTGEIDFLGTQGLPPERYKEAKGLQGIDVMPFPNPTVEFIYFNCGKPQFKDPRVRRALYLAADKEKWMKDVYYGTVSRTLSYLQPHHWAYNSELKDPGYDPRKAAQMLDAAGWKVGSDGIREKDGVKLKFTMSTSAGAKAREQAQALVQQNWKAINVAMEIRNFPGSVVWGEYTRKSQFDTLMVGWAPIIFSDADYIARCHSKQIPVKHGVGSNYVQYENSKLDRLLEEGVTTLDRAKRKEIYAKVQKILLDDVPFAPIFGYNQLMAKKSNIKGFKTNPYTKDVTWNLHEWYWE